MIMKRLSLFAVGFLIPAVVHAAELDSDGCRILSELPRPGVHPRVFFTADEYPRMRARLTSPYFKAAFESVRRQVVAKVRNEWGAFAEMDLSNPSDEEILQYFTSGEGRNINWGVASLTAVLTEDEGTCRSQ